MHGLGIAIVGLVAATAAAQSERSTPRQSKTSSHSGLRFAWPAGSRAIVTELRREGVRGSDVRSTFRYEIRLEADGLERRLRFGEVEVVSTKFDDGVPEATRQTLGQQSLHRIRPTLALSRTGEFRSALEFEKALDRAVRHEDEERQKYARAVAMRPEFRSQIEERQGLLWNTWVERWTGLEIGQHERDVDEVFPNGRSLPAKARFTVKRKKDGLLRIDAITVVDSKAATSLVRRLQPDSKITKFECRTSIHVDLAAGTMLPRSIVFMRQGRVKVKGAKPEPIRDAVRWDFDWQSPAAAPTRRR